MEQDQKLVIHCASVGDFHSPGAAGELFWGFSLPREIGTMCFPRGVRGLRREDGKQGCGPNGVLRDTSALWISLSPSLSPVPRVGQAQK